MQPLEQKVTSAFNIIVSQALSLICLNLLLQSIYMGSLLWNNELKK